MDSAALVARFVLITSVLLIQKCIGRLISTGKTVNFAGCVTGSCQQFGMLSKAWVVTSKQIAEGWEAVVQIWFVAVGLNMS